MAYECQIVVDFEFNPTDREYRSLLRQEILEIGAVKLNAQLEEIGRFSCLVRPEFSREVRPDITRLTGIRTADVENAHSFVEALDLLLAWAGPSCRRVITWSENDLNQLLDECWVKELPFPEELGRWMDFQKVWQRIIHYPSRLCMGLSFAARNAGIDFDSGRAHRALYDCEVTAELLRLTRDRRYLHSLAQAKSMVVTEVQHSSYSLGSACGGKLAEALLRLQTA